MTELEARANCPKWAANAVKIVDEDDSPIITRTRKHEQPKRRFFDWDRLVRRYGIVVIAAALFCVYTIILSASIESRTEKKVRQEMALHYASELEKYKAEMAEAEQAAHWLSGDASREAAINQEIDSVAPVIAKLSTDAQKATEVCCMLARVMNPSYPNSFAEVAKQPLQWMFYNGEDNTFSQHDREIAESIVRPYMEEGIVPTGLTSEMVYAEWSPGDYILRDAYKKVDAKRTFSYGG